MTLDHGIGARIPHTTNVLLTYFSLKFTLPHEPIIEEGGLPQGALDIPSS